MNLTKLFESQLELKNHIFEKRELRQEPTIGPKSLLLHYRISFKQEVAELVQEARFFKFWSENQYPDLPFKEFPEQANYENYLRNHPLIFEAVDCVCFLVDIGREKGFEKQLINSAFHANDDLTQLELTERMYQNSFTTFKDYLDAWCDLLTLVKRYNVSKQDLEQAYYLKTKVNHERQENNY